MSAIDQLIAVVPKLENTVEIQGVKLDIKPLTLMSAAKLIRRFPDAIKAIFGETDMVDALVSCGPEFLAAAIVASLDTLGNLEEELKVSQLPDDMQLEIFSEILAITMPEGLEAFLDKLIPLAEKMGLTLAPE